MVRVWLSVNLKRSRDRCARRSLDTRGPVSNVAQEKQAQEAKNAELHKIDRGDIPPLRIAALYAAGKA
jgi:hypothetical protein